VHLRLNARFLPAAAAKSSRRGWGQQASAAWALTGTNSVGAGITLTIAAMPTLDGARIQNRN